MTNDQIKAMLYEIIKTYSGFDGAVKGLLLVNDYIQQLENGEN